MTGQNRGEYCLPPPVADKRLQRRVANGRVVSQLHMPLLGPSLTSYGVATGSLL